MYDATPLFLPVRVLYVVESRSIVLLLSLRGTKLVRSCRRSYSLVLLACPYGHTRPTEITDSSRGHSSEHHRGICCLRAAEETIRCGSGWRGCRTCGARRHARLPPPSGKRLWQTSHCLRRGFDGITGHAAGPHRHTPMYLRHLGGLSDAGGSGPLDTRGGGPSTRWTPARWSQLWMLGFAIVSSMRMNYANINCELSPHTGNL